MRGVVEDGRDIGARAGCGKCKMPAALLHVGRGGGEPPGRSASFVGSRTSVDGRREERVSEAQAAVGRFKYPRSQCLLETVETHSSSLELLARRARDRRDMDQYFVDLTG